MNKIPESWANDTLWQSGRGANLPIKGIFLKTK